MNSIDDKGAEHGVEALLEALFDELLLPMAQQMRSDGVSPFPREPDVRWLSYYVRRRRSSMLPADFQGTACADAAEFEHRLGAHWRSLGRADLAAAAARFGAVAQLARAANAQQATRAASAELNPFVYAMF